jgi:hypothetical protein
MFYFHFNLLGWTDIINYNNFFLTYLLIELSPSGEAANCAATQELPSI